MKKILFALAALLIAFFAACSSDFGTGNSLTSGDGPITLPGSHKSNNFEIPDTTQVDSSDVDVDLSSDSDSTESSSSESED